MPPAQADIILNSVLASLNIQNSTFEVIYNQIPAIVHDLHILNAEQAISPKTTGTISERLCEFGLKSAVPDFYKNIGNDWNWMADFSVYGHPFNLLISVKSFKAKERLLVSGSGNNLSPTIGWGLFDDPAEWSIERVKRYLFRSFIVIYMPTSLYNKLDANVIGIKNINGNPFIRELNTFVLDLRNATVNNAIDISRI